MKEYDDTKYILIRKELVTFQKWVNWATRLFSEIAFWVVVVLVFLWSVLQVVLMLKALI